ncbi:tRNA pseudouridine(13) synthase TruD [Aliiglaciecola sp. CAU 1673]|uniref:tRNA pseudouridine(13) synthase TruD n=1 Tax=Aliiglaciecola sp. CAU 1673 TaxID=3032595 RepID=UPI0023DB8434|nr:tRNA pseudouridine(13) synthase TruD [Aliiglaciecola sp. CAU 1673]MDF2178974.1 tRNA pseudouridine(13) synthase TruD [Aliiglaciecola sp. CAU 1673]
MNTEHWHYVQGRPLSTGRLKAQNTDFIVRERLGFEPSGDGEHVFLWIRKDGANTAWVAEQLARFAKVHPRQVSFSGRKDKFAITEQWIGVHLPGKSEPDWQQASIEGVQILKAVRHNKKLRTGIHKANDFELVIRDISDPQDVEKRIALLSQGVPNYFGEQRFGRNNGNLHLGQRMLDGEQIRDRQKRSMAISALRAWLFNETISERITAGHFHRPLQGDIMILAGTHSFFCATEVDEDIEKRLQQRDIVLSAPLWGEGELPNQGLAKDFEQRIAKRNQKLADGLAALGLKQERRALALYPENLEWRFEDNHLHIRFTLPAGAFATAVVRELLQVPQENQMNNAATENKA